MFEGPIWNGNPPRDDDLDLKVECGIAIGTKTTLELDVHGDLVSYGVEY